MTALWDEHETEDEEEVFEEAVPVPVAATPILKAVEPAFLLGNVEHRHLREVGAAHTLCGARGRSVDPMDKRLASLPHCSVCAAVAEGRDAG